MSSTRSAAPPKAEQESSLKIYFRLLGYVKPYIGLFLLSIVGFVIFASTQPMLAGILKYFVDGLSNPDVVFEVVRRVCLLVFLLVLLL